MAKYWLLIGQTRYKRDWCTKPVPQLKLNFHSETIWLLQNYFIFIISPWYPNKIHISWYPCNITMISQRYQHNIPMISLWYSLDIPWYPDDISMISPWNSYDIPQIFPWYPHDNPMIIQWYPHYIPMLSPWYPCDMLVIFLWYPFDIPVISPWYPRDIPMIYPLSLIPLQDLQTFWRRTHSLTYSLTIAIPRGAFAPKNLLFQIL